MNGDPAVLQRHMWQGQPSRIGDALRLRKQTNGATCSRSPSSGVTSPAGSCACSWTRSSCDRAFAAARRRCSPRCRFSAGRDPGFSKPFPPDLSTRLSARCAPLACLTHRRSVYTFASSAGRWSASRRLAAVAGAVWGPWLPPSAPVVARAVRRVSSRALRRVLTEPGLEWRIRNSCRSAIAQKSSQGATLTEARCPLGVTHALGATSQEIIQEFAIRHEHLSFQESHAL